MASGIRVGIHELDEAELIGSSYDPVFDAALLLEEMEREQIMLGRYSNHEVVSSCVTPNWDGFEFAYEQLRAKVNAEKKENYRWARGWDKPPGAPGGKRVLEDIACGTCGLQFRPRASRDKFCSIKCSASRFIKIAKCRSCGAMFKEMERSTRSGYCSAVCGNRGRTKILLEFRGSEKTIAEWAVSTGISEKELRRRRDFGWDVEKMLTTPVKIYKKRSVA